MNKIYLLLITFTACAAGFITGWTTKPIAPFDPSFSATESNASAENIQAKQSPTQKSSMHVSNTESLSKNVLVEYVKTTDSSPNSYKKDLQLQLKLATLADKNIAHALDLAIEIGRPDLINSLLLSVNKSNYQDALAWIDNYKQFPQAKATLKLRLYRGLAKENHDFALQVVNSIEQPHEKDQATAIVVEEWAKKSPTEVFDWMSQQQISPLIKHTYTALMRQEISKDPTSYKDIVAALDSGKLKNKLTEQLGKHWALNDPQAALAWMKQQDQTDQHATLNGIIDGWTQNDNGKEALDYLMKNRDQEKHNKTFLIAAINLAYKQPDLLLSNFNDLTTDEQKLSAGHLVTSLRTNSPEKVQEWVEGIQEPAVKNVALTRLSGQIRRSDPSSAYSLALQISNEKQRTRSLKSIIKTANQTDPELAQKLILNSATIDSNEQTSLESYLKTLKAPTDLVIP